MQNVVILLENECCHLENEVNVARIEQDTLEEITPITDIRVFM